MALTVDVVSDVVCPWCFIGKRRLAEALEMYRARFPDEPAPEVVFHPFELNPQLPPEGITRREYRERKFGEAKGRQLDAQIAGIGETLGIAFEFDSIVMQPNTRAMHALIMLATESGLQDQVKEAFMKAYFTDGIDLTRREHVESVAIDAGMDVDAVRACLDDPAALAAVEKEEQQAQAIGVSGVPFFIFNRRLAVSGAHEPATLFDAMLQAEQDPDGTGQPAKA